MPDTVRLTGFRYTSSLRRSKRGRDIATSTCDINELVPDDDGREEKGAPDAGSIHGVQEASTAGTVKTPADATGPRPAQDDAVYMRRHATLLHCVCLILGATISPAVFQSPWVFVSGTTSILSSTVLILLSGAVCTVAALCCADLITAFKESGGEVIFFYRVLGDRAAYIQVWMSLIVGRTGGAAVSAIAFASLLILPLYPGCLETPKSLIRIVAAMTLLALFYVNCVSVKWTLRLQVVFTAIKVGGVLFIILGAVVTIGQGKTELLVQSVHYRADFEFSRFALALFRIINLFSGWMVIAFIAEEIININWTVPVAMLISIPLVTLIYVAINFAFVTVLTRDEILNHPSVAMLFASRVLGNKWRWFMPVTVAVSTLSAFNGLVMGCGRILMVASRLRCAPEIWSMLHVKSYTPVPAFLTYIPICLIMLHIDIMADILTSLASFGWISVAMSSLVLLLMKKKAPDVTQPYKVPKAFPISLLIVSLVIVGYSAYLNPIAVVVTMVVAMSFLPIMKLTAKLLEWKPVLLRHGEQVTLWLQKLLQVVHQEYQNY